MSYFNPRLIMSHRKIKKIFLCILIYILAINMISFLYDNLTNFDTLIDKLNKSNLKSIQILTYRFDYFNWKLGHNWGEEPFRNCAEKRCYAFKPLYFQNPNERADGIMVHGLNLFSMPSRTKYKRNRKQLWLFYSLESQSRTHCSSHYEMTDLDDWFNITATFKLDSDIVADYREFRNWKDIEQNKKYFNKYVSQLAFYNNPVDSITDLSFKNKFINKRYQTKSTNVRATISWIVSHCETMSRREDYVKELQKHIYVDVIGECGDAQDPCLNEKNKLLKTECLNEFLNTYKFYLSFENGLCQDYVTEKFWQFYESKHIFKINILPIVRGAQKDYYKQMAQPGSYINADDYKSPKELADYLIYLNENQTAYLEYFKWKIDLYKRLMIKNESKQEKNDLILDNWNVSVDYHLREPFCRLCALLHNQTYLNSRTNKIWYLSKWFNRETNCWDKEEPSYYLDKFFKFFGFCI